jgi:hypothetical protein
VVALGAMSVGLAHAQTPVGVPDNSFPESISAAGDGTLYAGSFNLGGVVKVAPGGKAEQFIKPGAAGSRSVLGVLDLPPSKSTGVCRLGRLARQRRAAYRRSVAALEARVIARGRSMAHRFAASQAAAAPAFLRRMQDFMIFVEIDRD